MTHVLRNLVSNYTLEYDVSGVSDPFLQIAILKFFRIMAENNLALSEDFSDILTQVIGNTSSGKSTGFAVLYECVKTIMSIHSTGTLKTLAINTLSKFLTMKDPDIRFVSLSMLKKVISFDTNAVSKHK